MANPDVPRTQTGTAVFLAGAGCLLGRYGTRWDPLPVAALSTLGVLLAIGLTYSELSGRRRHRQRVALEIVLLIVFLLLLCDTAPRLVRVLTGAP
jgi:hypothetical protein